MNVWRDSGNPGMKKNKKSSLTPLLNISRSGTVSRGQLFEDLDQAPVIIHTHHVVRRNDFRDKLFTFRGRPRHLFIFDEAMYRSLQISEDLLKSIDHIDRAILRSDLDHVSGLPGDWFKMVKHRLVQAYDILRAIPEVEYTDIDLPCLADRYVISGYRIEESDTQDFITSLMTIGADENAAFRVFRAQGAESGKALFAFKENDILYLPRVVNTDATRSVRKIHGYGSHCTKYPIPPYEDDEGVRYWIAPSMKTGKRDVNNEPMFHVLLANLWLQRVKPKRVLVISSKGMRFESQKFDEDSLETLISLGLTSLDQSKVGMFFKTIAEDSPEILAELGTEVDARVHFL